MPLVDQRRLFVIEVNFQSQPFRVLDNGTNRRVHDLIVQADLDAVTDFVFRFGASLGWHGCTLADSTPILQPTGTDTYFSGKRCQLNRSMQHHLSS
jgi:hypothetical protein